MRSFSNLLAKVTEKAEKDFAGCYKYFVRSTKWFDSQHYNENDTPSNLFEEEITTKESYKSVRGAFVHLSSNPLYTRDISYLFDQNI